MGLQYQKRLADYNIKKYDMNKEVVQWFVAVVLKGMIAMGRDEILAVLRDYKQSHQQQYGIKALGLFGSVSKGNFDENSDIDVFVEMERPDMFLLADIKQDIEQSLHVSVDIVRLRGKMNPVLKRHIDKDGMYV